MQLLEHEGKTLLAEHGIRVPFGRLATSVDQAVSVAEEIGGAIAVKAQVRSGRRGKHGGIQVAQTIDEVRDSAGRILGSVLGGDTVTSLLVEEAVPIEREIYLGVYFDRRREALVAIGSDQGGMEVEKASGASGVAFRDISLLRPIPTYELRDFVREFRLRGQALLQVSEVLSKLIVLALERDAVLAEVNPLAIASNGDVVALDAKIVIDDAAIFRQPQWISHAYAGLKDAEGEMAAKAAGISYVPLDGEVAIIANGTGLALTMMDLLTLYGSSASNFMDVGPVDKPEKIRLAVGLCLQQEKTDGLCINLYGGASDCRVVADAVLKALQSAAKDIPTVVRMCGHGEEDGWALLESAGVPVVRGGSTEDAIRKIVAEVGGRSVNTDR